MIVLNPIIEFWAKVLAGRVTICGVHRNLPGDCFWLHHPEVLTPETTP